MPFLANIECCLKFLEYPLLVLSIKMFEFYFQNHFLKYLNKFAVETGKKSSSKLAKSKPSNQSKICSKFQRCILAEKKKFQKLEKKLHYRCSTRAWIPTPLKLVMKTPEQHRSCCSCPFIVGFQQIFYIGFHAYSTYFRNSFIHCFELVNVI